MPTGKPMPATRAEIARNGHIAVALRRVMNARDWKIPDLNEAIGKPRGYTICYPWLAAKNAPGPELRAVLSQATGIPEAELMPRRPGEPKPVATAPLLALPGPTSPPPAARPVLVFSALEDGSIELELRKTRLPLEEGSALLRLLLDAGIVFRKSQPP